MNTWQQKLQAKHGVIYALLALTWGTPAAWAQTENTETPVVLEPVDVTGERYLSEVSVGGKEAVKPREIPQSVSVITKERIEDQGLVTLEDALRQITGITVTNQGITNQYRARGHTLSVSFDGISVNDMFQGFPQLDVAIYDRVEALRGPAGLFQGTSGGTVNFGGTINLVRKRAQKEFAASGSVSAGSWDNKNVQADVTGPFNESGSLRGRLVISGTDRGYFYDRAKTRKNLFYGTADWDITPATTLSLGFASQNDTTKASQSGLPDWSTGWDGGPHLDLPRSTNLSTDWSRYKGEIQDTFAELTHHFEKNWNLTAKFRHRDQEIRFKDGYANGAVNITTGLLNYARRKQVSNYEQDSFDIYLTGPFRLFGREHRATVGYNVESTSSRSKSGYANLSGVNAIPLGRPDLVPNGDWPYTSGSASDSDQSGYYGQLRLRLANPLTVIIGARVTDYRQRSRSVPPSAPTSWETSTNKTNDEVTPYAGVIFDINRQISLYASYSDIFAPQTNEKIDGSVLEPRVGAQYEIGSKAEFFDGRLIASLAFFNLREKNRPFLDPASPPGYWYYLPLGETESKGWEIEVSGSPAPGWNLQAGYTQLEATIQKASESYYPKGWPIDGLQPKRSFKFWGVRHFQGGPLKGLDVGLGVNYTGKTKYLNNWTPANNQLRTADSYVVADAFLSYRFNKNLSLSLNINNLFDKTYYARIGGTGGFNIYGEPRNFLLTLRANY
jgi:outer membrane receptor for ferric coprogen and ferric-rhodotorulic acid